VEHHWEHRERARGWALTAPTKLDLFEPGMLAGGPCCSGRVIQYACDKTLHGWEVSA